MALFIGFLYAVVFFDIFCCGPLEKPAITPTAILKYQKKYLRGLILNFRVLFKCSVIGRYSLAGRQYFRLEQTQTRLAQILNHTTSRPRLRDLVC
jgi:hypothetical protein